MASIGTPGLTDRLNASTTATALAPTAAAAAVWTMPDRRRALQLALASVWLLDGVLQLQPYMFTPSFGSQLIAATAAGNPPPVAASIHWVSHQVAAHAGLANLGFSLLQLGIGVGIAWRRTLRAALAVSAVWAIGVWWLGEGLGGLLSRTASPLTGAPGAALLYTLLAVLLWPVAKDDPTTGTSVAGRPLGTAPAKLLWIALWGSLAWMSLWSDNRAPDGLSRTFKAAASMAPGWAADLDRSLARGLAGYGLEAAIVLAVLFAVVALSVLVPPALARPVLIAAMLTGFAIWVAGESFGGIMMGQSTDPSSGPLLVLLAAAYWPVHRSRRPAAAGDGVGT